MHRNRGHRRRSVVLLATLTAATVVLVGCSSPAEPDSGDVSPGAQGAHERPADLSRFRPDYHLTPESGWKNDPQRPFLLNGTWHYYYLHNADYPDGNGTEWYHVTSTDLVHWTDQGVAIEKFRNGLGDIETGTAVLDVDNTAGLGAGTVIAIVTQQHEGVQRQSLFYSTDEGFSFSEYSGNPVMDNPGEKHWRDPRVVWDEANKQWLMLLAEGPKIAFYTSPNLKDWTYTSGFERSDLGILECPDFFQIDLDGDPAKRTWVLATGANGFETGRTTGTVYWTGDWDGRSFQPATDDYQWMDHGSDYYAAVTWDDPRRSDAERHSSRYALGWMNNWAYATQLPADDWQGGQDSLIREVSLATIDERSTLVSRPIDEYRELEGESVEQGTVTIDENPATADVPSPSSGSYRLDLAVRRGDGDDGTEARVRLNGANGVTVGYDFDTETAFIQRDQDVAAGDLDDEALETYLLPQTASVPPRDGVITFSVYVDYASVEVFVNGGERVLSAATYSATNRGSVEVATDTGQLTLESFRAVDLGYAGTRR